MSSRACPERSERPQLLHPVESPLVAHVRAALAPDLSDVALEREIGGGGMGRLFVGRRGGDRVVVKVLLRAAATPHAECRFRREAALGRRLRHPHLLPVLAAGETPSLLYLVLPFADGGTLRRRVRRDGPLSAAEAVRLLRPLADALAHLHAAGFVHGDVKPENVLLHAGRPVLADLGAARPLAGDGELAGAIVGTPLYMAPEQAAGVAADPRSDLYSLAVLAWELLVGRPPFVAASPRDVLEAHRTTPVPSLLARRADVPGALAHVIERALAKDPADRPASALEFRAALDRVAHAIRLRPAAPHRVPVARRVVTTYGRRAIAAGILMPLLASLAAAAVSAATFGGALGTVHRATAAIVAAAPGAPVAPVAPVAPAMPRERVRVVTASRAPARVAVAARTLPTVHTVSDSRDAHAALPSVFARTPAPSLLPLRAVRIGAAATLPRVVAQRASAPPAHGAPRWTEPYEHGHRCGGTA